jgi:arginine/serine-rich splicing factor 4/5/6
MEQATRPLFVGNLAAYVKPRHLTRLFEEKGTVAKIDLKMGFAFIFMPNLEEAEAAKEKFNNYEMEENNRRPLKVDWAKGDGSVKKREDDRKSHAQNNPCDTLFVVNFDTTRTRERDLEKLFDPYGKSRRPRVEIRRNYAFVQFDTVEEATEARLGLNGKTVDDRELTVEYVARQGSTESKPFISCFYSLLSILPAIPTFTSTSTKFLHC